MKLFEVINWAYIFEIDHLVKLLLIILLDKADNFVENHSIIPDVSFGTTDN